MNKPLIGLNADHRAARNDSPAFVYLCAGYFDAVAKAGGIPLIIPPLDNQADLDAALNLLDGWS